MSAHRLADAMQRGQWFPRMRKTFKDGVPDVTFVLAYHWHRGPVWAVPGIVSSDPTMMYPAVPCRGPVSVYPDTTPGATEWFSELMAASQ